MRNWLFGLVLLFAPGAALAQQPSQAQVVGTCGTPLSPYAAGQVRPLTQDTTGSECTAASVSASISGFTAASTGTPISVTSAGTGVTGNLPAGAVVVASNTGSTNAAYCKLGASATTSDQPIPPNSWFAFTVGASTQLTCITSASTTTVNMVGGAGLPTGANGNGSVALPANQSVNLAQVGGTNTVNGGVAGSQSVGGTAATNVAITANPMNLGAQGVSSENSAVTTARQVQLVADLVGKLIVLPYSNPENFVFGVTSAMTATTSTSVIAAPAGSLRNYITQCTFSNSHATVGTMMNLQDGSGGTTIYSFPAAPAYGGAVVQFPAPLRQPTAATALFVVNATTGSNTFAACSGYKGL